MAACVALKAVCSNAELALQRVFTLKTGQHAAKRTERVVAVCSVFNETGSELCSKSTL